ncbi:hypothetical protein EXN66_Car018907 [Channa argus]|uniref:Secreted protein n=1 Tax=Channa argus TaxID=215402 RepID=A0A6G1QLH6_CHAAH|nr:hypothetical protein EXN66_Car018907 [Channa argus]
MVCTHIVLFYLLLLKALYTASHSHSQSHTHSHTVGGAAVQLANAHRELKDTSTCDQRSRGSTKQQLGERWTTTLNKGDCGAGGIESVTSLY